MMIQRQHLSKNDTLTIDFREVSPNAIEKFTGKKENIKSIKTIAVPGFIRGLEAAHKVFGK